MFGRIAPRLMSVLLRRIWLISTVPFRRRLENSLSPCCSKAEIKRILMKREGHRSLRNLLGWRCATCGELITRIEDGWVEWLAGEDERANTKIKGLHLVHDHQASPRPQKEHGCQYDER